MFQKVLIPLDGSELSDRILIPTQRLLLGCQGDVVLLQVVDAEGKGQVAAEGHLNLVAHSLKSGGIKSTIRVALGDPADAILQVVDELEPELVAMASHGRTGLLRAVRGSVTERVLRHCRVPVLACNPHGETGGPHDAFKTILVPLDGSQLAESVLPTVAKLAKTYGSQVELLRVRSFVHSAVYTSWVEQGAWEWDPSTTEATLHPARDRLAAEGIDVTARAVFGHEADEILKAAEDVDLVAMTTHGRSGVNRWMYGSVAEQVVRHCSKPLLVHRVAGDSSSDGE